MTSSTACERCGARGPVRLGAGQICASCLSEDAWTKWRVEGKLVIERSDIEAIEARQRVASQKKIAASALAASTALLTTAFCAVCVYAVSRLFIARPIGPPGDLIAALRSAMRIAAGAGLVALVVSLFVWRLPYPRRGRLFVVAGRLLGITGGASALVIAGFFMIFTGLPQDFERLVMPPRTQSDLLPGPTGRVMDATVVIAAPDADGDAMGGAIGSGAIVAADSGRALVVTCSHVAMPYAAVGAFRDADSAAAVWVGLADGRGEIGRIIWTAAPPLDVALVEVRIDSPPAPVQIARSTDAIEANEQVFFVPNPLRRGFLVHNGKVLRREAHDTTAGRYSLLFTDLPVLSGDSGSGLFDARGHLIGLNTWRRVDTSTPQGISLPTETLAEIAHFMDDGAKGPSGAGTQPDPSQGKPQ